MTEHVDFELQETLRTDDGSLRPDARFLLPEGRSFVADSKVPLDAFLDVPRRPRSNASAGSTSSATRARPASTSAASLEGLPRPVQGR